MKEKLSKQTRQHPNNKATIHNKTVHNQYKIAKYRHKAVQSRNKTDKQ